jgi:hypothetical protein
MLSVASKPLWPVKLNCNRGSLVLASQYTVPDWEITATPPALSPTGNAQVAALRRAKLTKPKVSGPSNGTCASLVMSAMRVSHVARVASAMGAPKIIRPRVPASMALRTSSSMRSGALAMMVKSTSGALRMSAKHCNPSISS